MPSLFWILFLLLLVENMVDLSVYAFPTKEQQRCCSGWGSFTLSPLEDDASPPNGSVNYPKADSSLPMIIPSQVRHRCRNQKARTDHPKNIWTRRSLSATQSDRDGDPLAVNNERRRTDLISKGGEASDFNNQGLGSGASTKSIDTGNQPRRKIRSRKIIKSKRLHNRKRHPQRSGNLPDIYWRAISMEEVRKHPYFIPLPSHITELDELEDVRYFQQGSWQWETLHTGRCTTSLAAAAFGFLEPKAAQLLGVTKSWCSSVKAQVAYHRLQEPALRTLDEMKEVLLEERPAPPPERARPNTQRAWLRTKPTSDYPFAAKYLPRITMDDKAKRREAAERESHSLSSLDLAQAWGDAQESTSLLTALNYLWKHESRGVRLREVGMCGARYPLDSTETSLLVGATPDAIVVYPNGTEEVLEVKNHCPFQVSSDTKERYRLRPSDPFTQRLIFPQYISQLQLEMYCVGEECKSALFLRQTATKGAILIRLRRDDKWIEEMLYWLQKFNSNYVEKEVPPPRNLFWSSSRYRDFLQRTKEMSIAGPDIVALIPQKKVQRCLGEKPEAATLFLDYSQEAH